MGMLDPIRLNFRSILLVKGTGSKAFLQGLITKNIESLGINKTGLIYTFLLNVKGRIFADMFIWRLAEMEEAYALEMDSTQLDAIQRALKLYRLRKPIHIEPMPEKYVQFCSTEQGSSSGTNAPSKDWIADPRVLNFGFRSLTTLKQRGQEEDDEISRLRYFRHRLQWGIAEGQEMSEQIPLNMNGDLLNAISFEKGCYIGQELVARTYHMGVVRRRLMPFRWIDPKTAPSEIHPIQQQENGGTTRSSAPDLILRDAEGQRQGKLISSHGELGLCLASIEALQPTGTTKLFDGKGRAMEVRIPEWWPAKTIND